MRVAGVQHESNRGGGPLQLLCEPLKAVVWPKAALRAWKCYEGRPLQQKTPYSCSASWAKLRRALALL